MSKQTGNDNNGDKAEGLMSGEEIEAVQSDLDQLAQVWSRYRAEKCIKHILKLLAHIAAQDKRIENVANEIFERVDNRSYCLWCGNDGVPWRDGQPAPDIDREDWGDEDLVITHDADCPVEIIAKLLPESEVQHPSPTQGGQGVEGEEA